MKIGIMQPYFLPYIGYFQLMKLVDKFVVYDDVNYIKGGWINRNNILVGGQKNLFTITLNELSQNKLINEITIKDDFNKFLKTVQFNYSKAPFFQIVMELLFVITSYNNLILSEFIVNSFKQILNYLNIETEIIISSHLPKNNELKGKDKIITICKNLGADTYVNAIGGMELYNKAEFASNNINLYFLDTHITPYKQGKNEFIPNLSLLDVLMHNSVNEVNVMLDNYTLI